MKCNLDCDYCPSGIYGGHDNSQRHPPLDECLKSIDFMYQYADLMMQQRRGSLRHVVLNIYGGESLHHPDIVEILQAARAKHEMYRHKWSLRITTTTNAIIPGTKFNKVVDLVDEFTVSWHTNNTTKQKIQFRENTLAAQRKGKAIKCVVLMHPATELFVDAQAQINWCESNGIKFLPRQLDHESKDIQFNYHEHQVVWFKKLYQDRSHNANVDLVPVVDDHGKNDLADTGRACCGGRQLCANENHRERLFFVSNKFPDWYCSVDKFFLYVKQVNGEVYVNKDCKMNYNGEVGPIGNLAHFQLILDNLAHTLPVIQCKKSTCVCGLCAPKAQTFDQYNQIMKKYLI